VLAGEWRDGKLHYVVRARTSGDITGLRERLLALEIQRMPFVWPDRPTLEGGERWTKPELLCEVNFTARTTRGHIRHGMFGKEGRGMGVLWTLPQTDAAMAVLLQQKGVASRTEFAQFLSGAGASEGIAAKPRKP
jgi:hypothetical protein